MDVQPTTSHEIVQAENQGAIDALRRLTTTRDALARLYETQPSLTEASAQGARQLLDALPGFWGSPETAGGETRSTILGRYLASVMKEEATLRRLDGTLGDDAASLAARVATMDSAAVATGVHVRELILGDVAHAGSLIVVDDRKPDLALLFTTHGGWEAFDSLERLLQSTRSRLLESVDAADGTGLENDEFAEAKARDTVGSREIAGAVFATLANRMIDVQTGRISLAADDQDLDSDDPDAATNLGDRVRHELSLASMLDIDAIEHMREAYLLEAAAASRLANVPANVRDAWYEARDTYNDTLATAAMLRMAAGVQPALTLQSFASRELAARLASLGVDTSPEAITVEIARIRVLPEPLERFDPLPGSTKVRRVSLVELASQNIGRFSLDTLSAVDAQGESLRDRLGHGVLRDMVRDLDIANRYQTHLDEHLRVGAAGVLARKLATTVQAAQMRLEAAEARLSYYLPGEPRSFIDDRDERGFRWVEAALDAPAGQRRVDRHEITVSQLTYQQVPLDGILIFSPRASNSVPRVVVYTPGAPDGLTFREFESRQDAAKHFFYHPAFREYLLDRLPAEFATVSPNGATRQFAGDRLAHWVLGASGDASYTLTAEPFAEREVRDDFLAAAHDTTIEKYRRDMRLLSRSMAEADKDAWLGYLQGRFNGNVVANLAATALADLPASLARMTQAAWRFYDHVKAGDSGEAFVAFTEGYVNAVNLVVPPFIGGRHIAGAIVRSRTAAHGVASTSVRLTPQKIRFDDRYAVRSLRKPGKPDGEGIYRVQGQSYIEQEGTFFLVRHDADYSRWRLAPSQGAMDARFTGPLIEQVDGRWVHAHNVGLRGGMRRMCERMGILMRDDAPPVAAPAAEGAEAVARAPNAPRPLALPRVMEPARAEITAALTDNPNALVQIRPDGTGLKFSVPPRSALIVDPHLHPDIAELSAHQRRVFLHELDTRFPLHAERAEVMNIRGYAQADGRRVPSRPPSPGLAQGTDVQSPSISSSTGDPVSPAPTLTPSQQGRWDDALALARQAPRTPPRSSGGAASDVPPDTLPASEVVPRDEWPNHVWYFSKRRFQSEVFPELHGQGVLLGGDATWIDATSGMRMYPVSALPPEVPTGQLSEALGTSPVQQAGQRDPLGYAVQIDITRLRDAMDARRAVLGGTDFQMLRNVLPSGEYQYTLLSSSPVRIPSNYIINVSRRGGQPTRLPGVRH